MNFNNLDDLKTAGFTGFKTIGDLFIDNSMIPDIKGIYLILYLKKGSVQFVPVGTGGHFKGKNPNASISSLKDKWINNSIVIYIGKAGKEGSSATLKTRIKQYLGFGQGKNIGHWGGRLIWQIKDYRELLICWKPLPQSDPRTLESSLIQQFSQKYNKRPFANLTD
jgi:hypothetical protein